MKAILMSLVFALAAFAQMGTIDQQYSGPFDAGDLCCESIGLNTLAVGQGFIPTQNYLTGISVHLRNGAAASRRVQLMLRAGSLTGTIVNTSASVATVPANSHDWVDFDLCPIRLVPGHLYVIQLLAENGGGDLSWTLRGGNPYHGGAGYRNSQVMPWDYGFRTYYMPEATAAMAAVVGLGVPADVDRGVAFGATMSYQIIAAPQGAFVSAFATGTIANLYTVHHDWCKMTAGNRNLTFALTPPEGMTAGFRDVTAQIGINGYNLSSRTRQVNVR